MNVAAVLAGQTAAREVACRSTGPTWRRSPRAAVGLTGANADQADYVQNILLPTNRMEGIPPAGLHLPALCHREGALRAPLPLRSGASPWRSPSGTRKNCIQCNWCATVCPHAVIRPFLLKPEDAKGLDTVPPRPTPAGGSSSPSPPRTAWTAAPARRCAPPG